MCIWANFLLFLADRTIGRAYGTVCRLSVCRLSVCLFVCRLWRFVFWRNGWTDLHEIFREGVEWPWDDLITFWVNSGKPRDAVMLIFCQQHYDKTAGPICMKFSGKVWSDHGTTWLHFGSIRVNHAMPICMNAPQLLHRSSHGAVRLAILATAGSLVFFFP